MLMREACDKLLELHQRGFELTGKCAICGQRMLHSLGCPVPEAQLAVDKINMYQERP